jgi:NitT/TauT family transport system substrate-binding protein
MMPKPIRLFWITPVLIMAVLFCGLGATKATAAETQQVTYRLKWLCNMSTVGDLFADAQGDFKAEGLTVTIKPGGPERDAIRELELGYADFGAASADQVIRALTKGSPVVVVAQLFQVNPLQWIYRRNRLSITKLSDLKGKTIGVTFGKNDEMIFRALLAQAGMDQSEVQLYGVRLDYAPFYKGLVDLWPVYINTQGVEIGGRLRAAGEPVGFLDPTAYGIRFVANSVVTSQSIWNQRPEVVKRFVRALLKGWRQAIDPANNDLSISIVQQFDRDSDKTVLQQQLDITRRLIQPSPGTVVGAIDEAGWRQTEQIMLDHHQIPAPVKVVERLKPLIAQ